MKIKYFGHVIIVMVADVHSQISIPIKYVEGVVLKKNQPIRKLQQDVKIGNVMNAILKINQSLKNVKNVTFPRYQQIFFLYFSKYEFMLSINEKVRSND